LQDLLALALRTVEQGSLEPTYGESSFSGRVAVEVAASIRRHHPGGALAKAS